MKVFKFGGTSVANAENINKVVAILQKEKGTKVVVVSALGGITDLLVESMHWAASGKPEYLNHLSTIEERHLSVIKSCIPATQQSGIISFVKTELNHLETLLEGIHMLREITPKATAKISSFGELLSSTIFII